MTATEIKELEDRLWTAADELRANSKLTATEYSFPVLGLIFLRQAYNRFLVAKVGIEKDLPVHPQRGIRAITKNDFKSAKAIFLPDKAQWSTIINLPDKEDIGEYINNAMRGIEAEYEVLEGVLPKDYNLFEDDLLRTLVRIFNDEALDNVTGDVFGRIYEYFLNKFASAGAQEGGEFFTPPSLVNAIVNIIEPNHGIVFDPAVGSAGMFVQTAHFIEEKEGGDPMKKVTFYGQEKANQNTRLAKMNMKVHGLEGNIIQGNTFYEDKHDLVGQCDFVMANPPFNVDKVDKKKDSVKNDPRLPFGLMTNDNANYLWIQYFYAYLNDKGRAGFVMASSASDAGKSEMKIRRQLVDTGAVDVMVSIGTKFFYTRSLPCSLWFFDKGKASDKKRKDKTLMLDLRDVYRKVSSSLHDFTDEQLQNIRAIVHLYRGDNKLLKENKKQYQTKVKNTLMTCDVLIGELNSMKGIDLGIKHTSIDSIKNDRKAILQSIKDEITNTKDLLKTDAVKKDKDEKELKKTHIKSLEEFSKAIKQQTDKAIYYQKEYDWLQSRFPKDRYEDVAGLCKVVSIEDVSSSDYSLTAGRYVGVAPQIDEDFDYEERMAEIKIELVGLNKEAADLANTIQNNLTELGL